MSRASLIAWASAALLALVLPATAAAAKRASSIPVPPGFVGMDVDEPVWPDPFVDLGQQLGVMVASGVETVRVVFDWSATQPYESWSQVPSGERSQFVNVGGVPTNFSSIDQLVGLASQRGVTVLPTILDAPSWDGQTYPGGLLALPRSDAPFAAFVKALVRRYGPRGSFWSAHPYGPKVPIEMWQIWNEPNVPAFWPQQPYYSRYIALLRAAHSAIKSADPTAKVVLAGLPNYSWVELTRLYGYRGARNLFDVVAVHPYTKTPQGVITILSYVRTVMNESGDRSKPIIADEISWPSSQGQTPHNAGYDFATTEAGQARNLGEVMPMLVKQRLRLGIAGFYYYDWAGLERPNALAFDFSGLFHLDGAGFEPKPAYAVFKRDALAMEGCRAKGAQASICAK
jgi:Glycosyl hydrolase family 53